MIVAIEDLVSIPQPLEVSNDRLSLLYFKHQLAQCSGPQKDTFYLRNGFLGSLVSVSHILERTHILALRICQILALAYNPRLYPQS